MVEKLFYCPALYRVDFHAAFNEVFEVFRSFVPNSLRTKIQDCIMMLFFCQTAEWRLTCGKLVCVATEAPNIDLFAVWLALDNFWTHPELCAVCRMSQRSRICKHSAETCICNLDFATRVTQNVITFNVTMQHLILVHCVQTKSDTL